MNTLRHQFQRVYVWDLPVRIFHWVNALAVLVLCVTGWLIANPPAFRDAGALYDFNWFEIIRFLHFVFAYVFVAIMVLRLYSAFAGNKYESWRNFMPLRWAQVKELSAVLKVDLLQVTPGQVHATGHNAMAYFTYFGMFFLAAFSIVSGFALYAEMSDAWFPQLFTWAVPLFGSEFDLRSWHYIAMWGYILFTFGHVYLVFYHDYAEGHGGLSSIVGGWKFLDAGVVSGEHAGAAMRRTVHPSASPAPAAATEPAASPKAQLP